MNSFCGSPLWDNSLTWDAETPDFTPCFQETVLVWVPCLFLWLTCPFDVVAFKRSRNPPLPWTFLNIAKVLLSVVLIVTSAVEIAQALTRYADGHIVFPVEYYAPVARMVTFLLAVVLMTTARRRGVCTSGPLFIFWLLMSLASIVRYRSVILQVFSEDVGSTSDEQMEFRFVTIVVYCPVIVGQFLLSCFADTAQPVGGGKKAIKQCPESRASFLSKLLFWWFNSMAIMGFKRPLQMHNMWFLDQSNQTAKIAEDFSHHFEKEKQKRGALPSKKPDADGRRPIVSMIGIMTPLFRTFWLELTLVALVKLVSSVLTFVSPLVLDMLIAFYDYRIYVISMRMRSAMINAIYKKALALSSVARGQYTTGEIVNLMSVDTQRVMDYIQVYNLIWITPLQIGLAIWLLWGATWHCHPGWSWRHDHSATHKRRSDCLHQESIR
ncbi:hypothetical protein MRX96_054164 [Rhipicephalus microplus]